MHRYAERAERSRGVLDRSSVIAQYDELSKAGFHKVYMCAYI